MEKELEKIKKYMMIIDIIITILIIFNLVILGNYNKEINKLKREIEENKNNNVIIKNDYIKQEMESIKK